MKNNFLTLMLLIACTAAILAGCTTGSEIDYTNPSQPLADISDEELAALYETLLEHPVLVPDEYPDEIICTDYTAQGLLRICYQSNTDAKLKLQVLKDDSEIDYNLAGDGSIEDFPLQYGDGEYTARILENIKDDKYMIVESKTFDVALVSENGVFLNAVQNIDWDYDMLPIEDVRYIIAETLMNAPKEDVYFSSAEDLYGYVTQNIDYDDEKVLDLLYNYLPDIEQTYVEGKGICYDYASLLAAMLRSINIPTKLVKGYASFDTTTYHAWNEVYLNGQWIIIDPTRDAALRRSGMSYEPQKNADEYNTVHEY